jgi:alpha-L-rhamnosidase
LWARLLRTLPEWHQGGDHVLDPAQTDYEERALYVTHDITDYLRPGENAAGVMLGSGWFNQDEVWEAGKYSIPGGTDYGAPRARSVGGWATRRFPPR